MKNPWAGGLNCPQFSEIDLNGDGLMDLVAFERNFYGAVKTFINHGEEGYRFVPEYRQLFPEMSNWMLLRDFDCDGRQDIFTSVPAGVAVYRNEPHPGSGIKFTLVTSLLQSQYSNGQTPVYVASTDIPAIDDIDGDGDLDILSFDILGNSVEYHKNMSMENYGDCSALEYVLDSRCWGYFSEDGNSNTVTLFDTCDMTPPAVPESERHAGSTILSVDLHGNGLKDLLLGDITYPNVVRLTNGGSPEEAVITGYITDFPAGSLPVDLTVFPASYHIDVDQDGLKDLLVAPNNPNTSGNYKNVWFYRNEGTAAISEFVFRQRDFLQEGMIDTGERSFPVFFDENADGLLDIVIGNFGYFVASGEYSSRLMLLRNTGSAEAPAFEITDDDYADLGMFGFSGIYPAFGDMDGDGDSDMVTGDEEGNVHYFRNDGGAGNPAEFVLSQPVFKGIDVGQSAKPQIIDVNMDGLPDLLVGERSGTVNYFENTGTAENPDFNASPTVGEFGSVDVMPECCTGYSVPFMTKDSVGSSILYVSSEQGILYLFDNIDGNLNGTFNLVDSMNLYTFNSTISGSDLNGDGKTEFLSGEYAGGISLLKHGTPSSLGIAAQNNRPAKLRLSPNPTARWLRVEIESGSLTDNAQARIFNLMGQEMPVRQIHDGTENIMVDAMELQPGVYLLKVRDGDTVYSSKFMKE